MQILKTYEDVSDEKNKKCVLVDIKETGKSSVAYFKRYRQKIEGLRFGFTNASLRCERRHLGFMNIAIIEFIDF